MKCINDDTLKDKVENAHRSYLRLLKHHSIKMYLACKGKVITPEDLIDIFFNGMIFHRDQEKSNYIKQWEGTILLSLYTVAFQISIVALSNVMISLSEFIKKHSFKNRE